MKKRLCILSLAAAAAFPLRNGAADADPAAPAVPPPVAPATPLAPLTPSPEAPLEPSVRNEVDRALELADAWMAAPDPGRKDASPQPPEADAKEVFGLDGLSRSAVAVKLVGLQRVAQGTGYWTDPRPESVTNRVTDAVATSLAAGVLRRL